MISPRLNRSWWSAAHDAMKIASAAAALMNRNGLRRKALVGGRYRHRFLTHARRERRVGDEREEPRDVGVDPVRQDELEAEQQHAGERRKLKRSLVPRQEREHERSDDEQPLEETLQQVQVGDPLRVVLAPVPDRERRV